MARPGNIGSFSSDYATSGGRKPLGRPAGVQNKATAQIKNTILAVFTQLQEDPVYAEVSLLKWAEKETTEFYKIASKIIPLEIEAKVRHTITVKVLDEDDEIEEEDYVEDVEYEEINADDII